MDTNGNIKNKNMTEQEIRAKALEMAVKSFSTYTIHVGEATIINAALNFEKYIKGDKK